MTETPAGYYTDADAIRAALGKHGPLSRADLVKASDVPRDVLAKALYALKKQGNVIEEGELVMLAKGANTPQDARKEGEVSIPTTQPEECSTEQIKPVAHHSLKVGPITAPIPTMGVWTNPNPPETAQGECATEQPVLTGVRGDSLKAVIALQALYDLADESRILMAENVALKQRVTELERDLAAIPEALSAAQRYQEKIAKIQELLHG